MHRETTRSSLHVPGRAVALAVLPGLVALGACLLFVSAPAGLFALAVGGLGSAALAYSAFFRSEFEHAVPGTLSAVPAEPVMEEGGTSFTWMPFELVRDGATVRMQPVRDPARKALSLFFISAGAILVGLTVWFLWFARRGQMVPPRFRIEMTLAVVVASTVVPWLFLHLRATMIRKLDPAVIDRRERRFRFRELDLSFDRIVGLQLCAAWRKLRREHFPALELNVIWTESPDPDREAGPYRRRTLVSLCGVDPRLGPFAAELAAVLSVPLLNHATEEHWAREMRAARGRSRDEEGQAV